jgi:hypothetical protein
MGFAALNPSLGSGRSRKPKEGVQTQVERKIDKPTAPFCRVLLATLSLSKEKHSPPPNIEVGMIFAIAKDTPRMQKIVEDS